MPFFLLLSQPNSKTPVAVHDERHVSRHISMGQYLAHEPLQVAKLSHWTLLIIFNTIQLHTSTHKSLSERLQDTLQVLVIFQLLHWLIALQLLQLTREGVSQLFSLQGYVLDLPNRVHVHQNVRQLCFRPTQQVRTQFEHKQAVLFLDVLEERVHVRTQHLRGYLASVGIGDTQLVVVTREGVLNDQTVSPNVDLGFCQLHHLLEHEEVYLSLEYRVDSEFFEVITEPSLVFLALVDSREVGTEFLLEVYAGNVSGLGEDVVPDVATGQQRNQTHQESSHCELLSGQVIQVRTSFRMSQYFRNTIKRENYPQHYSNIKFKTTFRNCIFESFKARKWNETEEQDWDILWCEKDQVYEVFQNGPLSNTQRVNHFRLNFQLCRKDNLIKNLKKYKKELEKQDRMEEVAEFNFMPQTFYLPGEYFIFVEEFKRQLAQDSKLLWIMKPTSRCQGKGIFIVTKLHQIAQWRNKLTADNQVNEPYIVQKYIMDPLLLGSKKFDMRIYVLVTNYNPLTVYFYRSGFARFTHEPYNDKDTDNLFGHLTNVDIQKGAVNYDEQRGGKWLLDKLKLYLMSRYGVQSVDHCFMGIQKIVMNSLFAVSKLISNDKHCFELYGFDILLDSGLKPWLLEVNGGSSMSANTEFDFRLKCGLLDDTFTIVNMEKVLEGDQQQVGGYDLIHKSVPVTLPSSSMYRTLLGCQNDRKRNLKLLSQSVAVRLQQTVQKRKQQQQQKQRKESARRRDREMSKIQVQPAKPRQKKPSAVQKSLKVRKGSQSRALVQQ